MQTQSVPPEFLSDMPCCFVWPSNMGDLWCAQFGGRDPSELYMSTDRADALEQAGYDPARHQLIVNDSPDLEYDNF